MADFYGAGDALDRLRREMEANWTPAGVGRIPVAQAVPGAGRYVEGCQPACYSAGCQLGKAVKMAENAMLVVDERNRSTEMSGARWCDLGEHSFSPRDPDSRKQVIESPNGEREEQEICGLCLAEARKAAKLASAGTDRPGRVILPPATEGGQS